MSASTVTEPSGTAAGRVTITTTLTSLLPPFVAVLAVVGCAMLEILDKETAGAVVLGILATAGLTTGTVFSTAKKTPTDQYATRTEVIAVPAPDLEAKAEAAAALEPLSGEVLEAEDVPAPEPLSLSDEVAQVRNAGSTIVGAA